LNAHRSNKLRLAISCLSTLLSVVGARYLFHTCRRARW